MWRIFGVEVSIERGQPVSVEVSGPHLHKQDLGRTIRQGCDAGRRLGVLRPAAAAAGRGGGRRRAPEFTYLIINGVMDEPTIPDGGGMSHGPRVAVGTQGAPLQAAAAPILFRRMPSWNIGSRSEREREIFSNTKRCFVCRSETVDHYIVLYSSFMSSPSTETHPHPYAHDIWLTKVVQNCKTL